MSSQVETLEKVQHLEQRQAPGRRAGRDHLAAELAVVSPKIVACLGAVAWREMTGGEAPFRPRRPAAFAHGNVLLYAMYHPAYVVRGAYSEKAYARDFMRLGRLVRELAAPHTPEVREQYPVPVNCAST